MQICLSLSLYHYHYQRAILLWQDLTKTLNEHTKYKQNYENDRFFHLEMLNMWLTGKMKQRLI